MLKQQGRLIAAASLVLDLLVVAVAFLAAYGIRTAMLPQRWPELYPTPLYPLASYLPLLPLALALWALTLIATGRYRSHRTVPLTAEALGVLKACAGASVLFVLAIFLFRVDTALFDEDRVSRSWMVLFFSLSFLLLVAEKLSVRLFSRWVRDRGYNYRTVLIVGTNEAACRVVEAMESHGYWGFRVVGFVRSEGEPDAHELPADVPILGTVDDVPQIVQEQVVDDVFFALPRRDLGRLENLFLCLHEQGIRTRFALNLLPHGATSIVVEELDGLPLLSISPTPSNPVTLLVKRTVDVSVSVLVLLLGLPIIVLTALAIKVSSGGTVLYRQTRCGLNGRRFTLYKFRTMVEDAHEMRPHLEHLNEMRGPAFKLRKDPRVTRLGRWLRKFSLDELPQLWNVLRGDMSLVGPRPPIPEEVTQYSRWQRRRLSMKPGLTCLWQINGRNELGYDRGIELDLEYIDSWSPSLDFKILLKTIPVVLSGRGAF